MKNLTGVKRLAGYLRKTRKRLIFILLMSVIVAVLELIPAQIVGRLVDFLPTAEMQKVILTILAFGCIYFLTSILKVIYGNTVMEYTNRIIEDVRTDLFGSLMNREIQMSDRDISGDLITRVSSDVEQITRVVAGPLNGFLGKMLNFLFALVLLGTISIRLVLITVVVSAILYWLSKDISAKSKQNGGEERAEIGSISRKLADDLRNLPLIKEYEMEQQETEELNRISGNIFRIRKKLLFQMTKYWGLVEFCNGMGYVFAFLLSIQEIYRGTCSVGQVVVIYSYLQMIFSSMISVSRYKTDIYNADAAMRRVFDLIPESSEKIPDSEKGSMEAVESITVDHLAVRYGGRTVIKGISFELKKGKLVALAGESGKGKSSILHALVGFAEIAEGRIWFDGKDVTEVPGERRKHIRIAFQNAYLFQKTVDENLRYGGQKENWCGLFQNTGIDQIVEKAGVDSVLDSSNHSLSGGEQRRLSLYRTVNKRVSCYLFDEPTAELDADTRQQVIDALLLLKQEAMLLVVTHDETLMNCADQLISLDNEDYMLLQDEK